jgi:hypothetical protein
MRLQLDYRIKDARHLRLNATHRPDQICAWPWSAPLRCRFRLTNCGAATKKSINTVIDKDRLTRYRSAGSRIVRPPTLKLTKKKRSMSEASRTAGWCYCLPSPLLMQTPGHIDYHDSTGPLCEQTNGENVVALIMKKILVPTLFDELRQ